jgi:hypothetical protein
MFEAKREQTADVIVPATPGYVLFRVKFTKEMKPTPTIVTLAKDPRRCRPIVGWKLTRLSRFFVQAARL